MLKTQQKFYQKNRKKQFNFENVEEDEEESKEGGDGVLVEDEDMRISQMMEKMVDEERRPSKSNHERMKSYRTFQTTLQGDEGNQFEFEKFRTVQWEGK